jgi:hypothetical protein
MGFALPGLGPSEFAQQIRVVQRGIGPLDPPVQGVALPDSPFGYCLRAGIGLHRLAVEIQPTALDQSLDGAFRRPDGGISTACLQLF